MEEDKKPPFEKQSYIKIKDKNKIKKYIFNKLIEEGWTKESAIGLIGNLSYESAQFTKFQEGDSNIYNTKGVGSMQWTDNPNVDKNGKPLINKKTGKPLAPDMRGQAFLSWSKKNNYSPDSLKGNVKYMIHEMKYGYYPSGKEGVGKRNSPITGKGVTYNTLKSQTNINQSTALFTSSLYRPDKDNNGEFLGAEKRLNSAVHFNSIQDRIHLNSTEKGFKKLNDKENLKVYKKYEEDLKKEGLKLAKGNKGEDGGITNKVYAENIYQIKKEAQLKYGDENLQKGNELLNNDKREKWQKGNENYQKTIPLEKEINLLQLKEDIGKLDSKGQEKLKELTQKRNSYLAKIRINADTKKVERIENDILSGKIAKGTTEYEETIASLKSAKKNINDLKYRHEIIKINNSTSPFFSDTDKVFKKTKIIDDKYELKEKDEKGDYIPPGILGERKFYNPNVFKGDFTQSNNDLWHETKYDSTPLYEEDITSYNSSNDLNYNPNKDYTSTNSNSNGNGNSNSNSNDNVTVVKKPDIDFTESLDVKDLLQNAPSLYQDNLDKMKKQSAKGYLKDNPMAFLSTALGIKGFVDSQKKTPDISIQDSSALSSSFYEYLNKLETISKQGFTPEEEAAHLKKINDGYMASVDLAVQASGGNRAQVLSQASGLNANKNDALLNYASTDAKLNRDNLEKYGKALQYSESFNERKNVRQQKNDFIYKKSIYDQALSRQKGGSLLAASSIKSLVDSINSYKETGEGSVLDTYRKYIIKKQKGELTSKGANGEIYKNAEDYNKQTKELSSLILSNNMHSIDFGNKVKAAGLTRDESESLRKKMNLLTHKQKNDYYSGITNESTKADFFNIPFDSNNQTNSVVSNGLPTKETTPPEIPMKIPGVTPEAAPEVIPEVIKENETNVIDGIDYAYLK